MNKSKNGKSSKKGKKGRKNNRMYAIKINREIKVTKKFHNKSKNKSLENFASSKVWS